MNTNIIYISGFFITLLLSLAVTPLVARLMRKIGKVGRDIHKPDLPEVPESVGLGYILVFFGAIVGGYFLAPNELARERLGIFALILFLVVLVGLYDDFKTLSAIMKPGILVIISLPVVIFQVADPKPVLPFIGPVRITLVYWIVATFVVAITSNASNMLDVLNGSMSGTSIMIAVTAFIASYIVPLDSTSQFVARYGSLTLTGALIGFWWFNRYPAKVFAGDTGSLGTGAAIGLIAIYGKLEFVLIVALLVHIMNSFSIITSIGGLRERREIKARPVSVKNGVIHPSTDKKAPITLVRLLVAAKPKTEDEIVKDIYMLVFYTCLLAIITAFLIRGVSP